MAKNIAVVEMQGRSLVVCGDDMVTTINPQWIQSMMRDMLVQDADEKQEQTYGTSSSCTRTELPYIVDSGT
jgi:hypothetical protein